MKILFLDIETAPNTGHIWGLWNQNINLDMLVASGYTICWAAKWYKKPKIFSGSLKKDSMKKMLETIHKLLDEADVVVHFNGKKFDIPTLNKEFIQQGYAPPAPYRQIDLLTTCRREFRFPSNKLEYVVVALDVGTKLKHKGYDLWKECMAGKKKAFQEMSTYNRGDVVVLEPLYDKLRPWIKNHPIQYREASRGSTGSISCPTCASISVQRRGTYENNTYKYRRYQCTDCHRWFRMGMGDAHRTLPHRATNL